MIVTFPLTDLGSVAYHPLKVWIFLSVSTMAIARKLYSKWNKTLRGKGGLSQFSYW
jgi:hypothetical protein